MMKQVYQFMQAYATQQWKTFTLCFAFLLLLPSTSWSADIKLEAEDAILSGTSVATSPAGFSGTGYVWGFDEGSDRITFTFPAQATTYELTIQYYSPFGEKGYGLEINGQWTDQKFTGTGEAFGATTVGKFQLVEGQNTITIHNGWGWYGIDNITLAPVSDTPPVIVPVIDNKVEAELGTLTGVDVATFPAGFSGNGYVNGFDNATDKVSLTFIVKAGLYEVSIGYISPYGEKGYDLQVNDEKGNGMFAVTGDVFSSIIAGKFLLKEGQNTITVGRGWGYYGIDYIGLKLTTAPLPVKPPKQLVDAQATSATRSLFSYLVDIYGSKVLSSQQDYPDMEYIHSVTGKEPAIGGFDLIEYSPSRIEYGSNPGAMTEKFISWAKKGESKGMINLMWHWNAPTDLINQAPDKLWWSGFYTRATTFDLAAALADKNSDRYKLLIRDIDTIAVQLKKFRDADVPVLWRPLHEAAGGWFWWGAKGAEPFKELWKIMYHRLTDHHQLHNLIWVYTSDHNMDWYPGDNYVDIVGPDIYADPSANMSGDWLTMQNMFGSKKLVALTETGNPPVPDKIRGYGTWWSWFMVWSGSFIRNKSFDFLNSLYHDLYIITLDELPNWRAYGQPSVTITKPVNQAQFITCQTPVLEAATVTAPQGSAVEKVVFLANGKEIGTYHTAGDGWKVSWANAPAGTHILTAKATSTEGITGTSSPITLVIKNDTESPVITVKSQKTILRPANHKYHTIRVQDFVTAAKDNCMGTIDLAAVKISQASSDEAQKGNSTGNTTNDIVISSDCRSVQLRAERSDNGNGRVYTIQVAVMDPAGNIGTASYEVQVPVDPAQQAKADKEVYTVKASCTKSSASSRIAAERVDNEKELTLSVYPNPVSGQELTIQIRSEKRQQATFTLVNHTGQTVIGLNRELVEGMNQVQLPIQKTAGGVYMLQIRHGNHQLSKKVVIVR